MTGFSRWLVVMMPWLAGLLAGGFPCQLQAHEGPPFPLFMDKPLGAYRVSLWADPDIGEAQFFVILETPDGTIPESEPGVALWAEPTSGRLARQEYPAVRQSLRNHMQFEAKPYFDQQDFWQIGVRLTGPDGQEQELVTEVESTPPGLGPWDLAIYLFPFVLLGGLWCMAMIRRWRNTRGRSTTGAAETTSTPKTLARDGQTATGGVR